MPTKPIIPSEPVLRLSPGDELILGHAAGIPLEKMLGVAEWRSRERELIVLGLLTEDGKNVTSAGSDLLARTFQERKRAQVLAQHGAKANGSVPGRTIPEAS